MGSRSGFGVGVGDWGKKWSGLGHGLRACRDAGQPPPPPPTRTPMSQELMMLTEGEGYHERLMLVGEGGGGRHSNQSPFI